MSRFTPKEIEYLQSQRLGRMATIGANGDLHVVPLSFRYNHDYETIDLGGHNIVGTKKYRDALRYGRVAFVVDDVLPPWKPRFVEVRGTVEPFADGGKAINSGSIPHVVANLVFRYANLIKFPMNACYHARWACQIEQGMVMAACRLSE